MSGRPVVVYSLLRLVVFAGVAGVLYALGLRRFGLVIVAILVSGVVSYFALARWRGAVAVEVAGRVDERRRRRAERQAVLDEQAEQERLARNAEMERRRREHPDDGEGRA